MRNVEFLSLDSQSDVFVKLYLQCIDPKIIVGLSEKSEG